MESDRDIGEVLARQDGLERGQPESDRQSPRTAGQEAVLRTLEEACADSARKALEDRDTYASLAGTIRHIAADYRHRAVFELIQNAHDAHDADASGHIHVRFSRSRDGSHGEIHVANRGNGFTWDNVNAVRRPARSTKRFGEGIGNKGLGFRSVHVLTQTPEVYSCQGVGSPRDKFDGFCFRFATDDEALEIFRRAGATEDGAQTMLKDMPRSLLTVPIREQDDEVTGYAREGFATLLRIPLLDAAAVGAAEAQVRELLDSGTPPALFLERISILTVEMITDGRKVSEKRIERKPTQLGALDLLSGTTLHHVEAGRRNYLVVRRVVPREPLEKAIRASLKRDERLESWLGADEETIVSIAVPLGAKASAPGRIYCYLPLGAKAQAPLHGHLNAPFLVSLNRKEIESDIPLNTFLLDMCAEAALAAARHLVEIGPQQVGAERANVVDLICWDVSELSRLRRVNGDRFLKELALLPTADGTRWTTLAAAYWWEHRGFHLNAPKVARIIGAPVLDPALGSERLDRIAALARSSGLRSKMTANDDVVARWVEAVARDLHKGRRALSRWGKFLDEVVEALKDGQHNLASLRGKDLFLDKDAKLLKAQVDETTPVYMAERAGGRRHRSEAPPPPRSLRRRFRLVSDAIRLDTTTRAALLKAGLVSEYDPLQVLRDIPGNIAKAPKDETLRQILEWAFRVWLVFGREAEEAVKAAMLSVPTADGSWRPAAETYFSGGWSDNGQRLETICRELAAQSKDAAEIAGALLLPYDSWPKLAEGSLTRWREFLSVADVVDGMRPFSCIAENERSGYAHNHWRHLLVYGNRPGFSPDWKEGVKGACSRHPQSNYGLWDGSDIWRLPAQSDHDRLSDEGKTEYAHLVLSYLAKHRKEHLDFILAHDRSQDSYTLPTPLRMFLSNVEWMPCVGPSGAGFARPSDLWWRRGRGRDVPRVLLRPHEDIRPAFNDQTWRTLVDEIGLNDWMSPSNAVAKLRALAGAVEKGIVTDETRGLVRAACAEAWNEIVDQGAMISGDLPVIVNQRGHLEVLRRAGADAALPRFYVTEDIGSAFEARLLADMGAPIIEGVTKPETVAQSLRQAGFNAITMDEADIALEVDGQRFATSMADPRLMNDGRGWIADLAVLALDVEGRSFAKAINRSHFRAALGRVRLRFCDRIRVMVDGTEVPSPSEAVIPVRDRERPTIVIAGRHALDWSVLRDLGRPLERVVDGRADGAVRYTFLQVATELAGTPFARPQNDLLARLLRYPVERINEVTRASATGSEHIVTLVAPVVACWVGIDAAKRLLQATEDADGEINVSGWLEREVQGLQRPPEDVVALCRETDDRDALRRALALPLGDFNRALAALGQAPLENRANLKGHFDYHLQRLRPELLERLRRHFMGGFLAGQPLDEYLRLRALDFVSFDEEWLLTQEELTESDVRARADETLDGLGVGDTANAAVEPYKTVHTHNASVMGEATAQASVSVYAWCRKNGRVVPEQWALGRAELVRALDALGLLDFTRVPAGGEPVLFARATFWPSGMPASFDPGQLGLTSLDLANAQEQRADHRTRADAQKRQIRFNGVDFNGDNATELEALVAAARSEMASDAKWQSRCKDAKLVERPGKRKPERDGGAGRGAGGRQDTQERLSEAQRRAVGLLGEIRAFEWIKDQHGLMDDEAAACWVSRNRRYAFLGADGDDNKGFDFEVVLKSGRRYQYEVKASQHDPCQFELGSTEIRAALKASPDRRGSVQYHILYVPSVTTPGAWRVIKLPNPLAPGSRHLFDELGRGALRFGFPDSYD
jgi:hypothetical protein